MTHDHVSADVAFLFNLVSADRTAEDLGEVDVTNVLAQLPEVLLADWTLLAATL